ncbi:hypothetical protein HMPREF9943_01851 [Eggerthia catenaformis OT 569 = DSM 20559]|uniref:Zinc-ribbon domain-containing protein n=1 Tax=Eggerthia catenaformis OT 569 = DSM 20559 TaxID=999415 RepID=M2PJZ5_9FIRM|nr:PrsW family glutamic-type intramembrane protease [Eggerthia catenaformis]EMD15904.1 hypothetical protein HMPREF9943_01851 [Eggerthia catenaformis OT 569 = DSM 20559]
MLCPNCGKPNDDRNQFCIYCGKSLAMKYNQNSSLASDLGKETSKLVDDFTSTVDKMTGGTGFVKINYKDFFSNVFVHHSREESETLLSVGTAHTTPSPQYILRDWPKPWLYSRIFLILAITTILLFLMYNMFGNTNLLPGLMFVGAAIFPLTVLIFLFEANTPRNVSFATIIYLFFIGGVTSLFLTLILNAIFPASNDTFGAIVTAIVEETAKFIIVGALIQNGKGRYKYILNGILIGAAVGAGFAVFESAGYIFRYSINSRFDPSTMLRMIFLSRGIYTIGGHVVWASIEGAGIMIALNKSPFDWGVLASGKFLSLAIWSIGLHAVWDMNFWFIFSGISFKIVLLIIIGWIVLAICINRGVAEINTMHYNQSQQIY